MLRSLSAALLILLVSLAGCTDKGNGTEGDNVTVTETLPDARMSFTASATAGATPFLVNFTLDFTDIHGRTVSWSIDADADGTADAEGTLAADGDASHEHLYIAAGTYNATASATINGTSLSETIPIMVTYGATLQTFSASDEMDFESCQAVESYEDDGFVPDAGEANATASRFDIQVNVDTRRQGYQVTWTYNASFMEAHTFFTTENGTLIETETGAGPSSAGITMHGTIPKEAYWVVLFACGGPAAFEVEYVTPRPTGQ